MMFRTRARHASVFFVDINAPSTVKVHTHQPHVRNDLRRTHPVRLSIWLATRRATDAAERLGLPRIGTTIETRSLRTGHGSGTVLTHNLPVAEAEAEAERFRSCPQ